jgi:hypothetical protein
VLQVHQVDCTSRYWRLTRHLRRHFAVGEVSQRQLESTVMKPSSIGPWIGPTLGGALALVCAAGLAYKVISGYQPASPEHFIRLQDRNKVPAASATAPPASAAAPPVDAPPDAAGVDLAPERQDDSECAAINTEQHEIDLALHKQHSPEETRYLQRRLGELAEQSNTAHC